MPRGHLWRGDGPLTALWRWLGLHDVPSGYLLCPSVDRDHGVPCGHLRRDGGALVKQLHGAVPSGLLVRGWRGRAGGVRCGLLPGPRVDGRDVEPVHGGLLLHSRDDGQDAGVVPGWLLLPFRHGLRKQRDEPLPRGHVLERRYGLHIRSLVHSVRGGQLPRAGLDNGDGVKVRGGLLLPRRDDEYDTEPVPCGLLLRRGPGAGHSQCVPRGHVQRGRLNGDDGGRVRCLPRGLLPRVGEPGAAVEPVRGGLLLRRSVR